MWDECLRAPVAGDADLIAGAQWLGLDPAEVFVLATLNIIETSPALARLVAQCQNGEGAARPTPDTLCRACAALGLDITPAQLIRGALMRKGMIVPMARTAPLGVTPVALSDAMLWAMKLPQDARLHRVADPAVPAPPSYLEQASRLTQDADGRCLVVRGGTPADQTVWVCAAAKILGRVPVLLPVLSDQKSGETHALQGLAAALTYAQALPVERLKAAPGQRADVTDLEGFGGCRIVLAGQDGGVQVPGWAAIDVELPTPDDVERAQTWAALGAPVTPSLPRVGPGRLAAIAARLHAGDGDLRLAAGIEAKPDIEPHGRLVAEAVEDAQMILSDAVQSELELLAYRCEQRAEPGVRALLAGPSGSGKTLASGWLATRLGQPLFKVDLASVVSKYIGETEENLARILDQAEAADVILLFDEADSLFGARTEAKDSSDRYANSQTNYLLSRIETHRGITLLTTNGMQRMDSAFARRLDQMIDVPLPDARQRLRLWEAFLGCDTALTPTQVKRIARVAEIAGGHIKSVSRTARLMAAQHARPVGLSDVTRAMALAYRGMGRTPPDIGDQP